MGAKRCGNATFQLIQHGLVLENGHEEVTSVPRVDFRHPANHVSEFLRLKQGPPLSTLTSEIRSEFTLTRQTRHNSANLTRKFGGKEQQWLFRGARQTTQRGLEAIPASKLVEMLANVFVPSGCRLAT